MAFSIDFGRDLVLTNQIDKVTNQLIRYTPREIVSSLFSDSVNPC